MSDKPSYLGLLNTIALAETRAECYLSAWAEVTQDDDVRAILKKVALREGVLSVRDQGPGFEERDLPHVFDRFYRADDARRQPGSGLGLAIVRQAVEAHGGHAEAANDPRGGARLEVSFGRPTA